MFDLGSHLIDRSYPQFYRALVEALRDGAPLPVNPGDAVARPPLHGTFNLLQHNRNNLEVLTLEQRASSGTRSAGC